MKYLKAMRWQKKILYTLSLLVIAGIFYSYNTNFKTNDLVNRYLHRLPAGVNVETTLMDISNSLDLRKIVKTINDRDVVGLEFSVDDIREFDNTYSCSEKGFLRDRCKSWRKVKVKNGNFQSDIKIKLSGTSTTPYRRSHSFYDLFYRRFIDQTAIYNATRGGYSYVLKFEKDKLFNNQRRVSLLSPFDEWSYFQNVLNLYASEKGLITTFGRPYLLTINGIDSGVHLAQETIGKELLERNYGITDYAILKPSDDWDSIPFGHQNHTDYVPEDKEQSGTSTRTIGIAQNQLRTMLITLDVKDFEGLSRYFDIDYMAKISAMQLVYGTLHSSIGDNRRYIYNISNGYFYPTFRMEGNPEKLSVKDGIIPLLSSHYQSDKILDLFETNEHFLTTRNQYLAEFIGEVDDIRNKYSTFKRKYDHLIKNTNQRDGRLSLRNDKGLSSFYHNVDTIKRYIAYNKIYTTEIQDRLGGCRYSIFVDSFSKIRLTNYELNGLEKKQNFELKIGQNYVDFDENKCLKKLQFENLLVGKIVDEDDVYYNLEHDVPTFTSFKKYFKYIDTGRAIRILEGNYHISKNIKFPEDREVLIEPGVKITIGDEKSILFYNKFTAVGTAKKNITFMPSDNAFGSILIRANGNDVNLDNVHVYGGNEAYVEGVYASGQIVIVDSNVEIKNSTFKSSLSDDGINIKYSTVDIDSNKFANNYGDQIDCDYCSGSITNNSFTINKKLRGTSETDGLDVSGSRLYIANNFFSGFSDKALSVGEKSKVVVVNNTIDESNIGTAVKDGSEACFSRNEFQSNSIDITSYVKKSMYTDPKIILAPDQIMNDNLGYALRDSCNDIK